MSDVSHLAKLAFDRIKENLPSSSAHWEGLQQVDRDLLTTFATELLGEQSRFTNSLFGVIADCQKALGITDDEAASANGSVELVAAIEKLKRKATSKPSKALRASEFYSTETSSAAHAIGGAIEYGRHGINPPKRKDHWLQVYWDIGCILRMLAVPRGESWRLVPNPEDLAPPMRLAARAGFRAAVEAFEQSGASALSGLSDTEIDASVLVSLKPDTDMDAALEQLSAAEPKPVAYADKAQLDSWAQNQEKGAEAKLMVGVVCSHQFVAGQSDPLYRERPSVRGDGPSNTARVSAEVALEQRGVFKGAQGLRGLLEADQFWDRQTYGTRLYYGEGGQDYLHRQVLRAAVELLDNSVQSAAV